MSQLIRIQRDGSSTLLPIRTLNIEEKYQCPTSWVIYLDEKIGEESLIGQVFPVQCGEIRNYVMKRVQISRNEQIDEFEKEAYYQNLAANQGLTVPVIDAFEYYDTDGKQYLGFITFLLQETLEKRLRNIYRNISTSEKIKYEQAYPFIVEALKLLLRLHSTGIYHGDPHLNNFILTSNGELLFIDFGLSGALDAQNFSNKIKYDYRYFFNSLKTFFSKKFINDYLFRVFRSFADEAEYDEANLEFNDFSKEKEIVDNYIQQIERLRPEDVSEESEMEDSSEGLERESYPDQEMEFEDEYRLTSEEVEREFEDFLEFEERGAFDDPQNFGSFGRF